MCWLCSWNKKKNKDSFYVWTEQLLNVFWLFRVKRDTIDEPLLIHILSNKCSIKPYNLQKAGKMDFDIGFK